MVDVARSFYFKSDAGVLRCPPANADPAAPHDARPEEGDIALAIHRIAEATTLQILRPLSSWAGLRFFVVDAVRVTGRDVRCESFYGWPSRPTVVSKALLTQPRSLLLGEFLPQSRCAKDLNPHALSPLRVR